MKANGTKFICPVCGQHFATSARYIEHMLAHAAQSFTTALFIVVAFILLSALPSLAKAPALTYTDNTFEVICDEGSTTTVSVEVTFADGAVQLMQSECNQKRTVGATILFAQIVAVSSGPNAVHTIYLPEVLR